MYSRLILKELFLVICVIIENNSRLGFNKIDLIMLIRFSIENFLSFNSKNELLLTPGKSRDLKDHIIKKEKSRDLDILKSALIFGANASGKTNLIKAIAFGQKLIKFGRRPNQPLPYRKYKLDKTNSEKNSKIEYEFNYKGKNYAYGFVFNHQNIIEEWLFEFNKEKDYKIFERKSKDGIVFIEFDKLDLNKHDMNRLMFIAEDTLPNELFLTAANKRNIANIEGIDPILNVFYWFDNILNVIFPESKLFGIKTKIQDDRELTDVFQSYLHAFRTGISGISTLEVDFKSPAVDLPEKIKTKIAQDLQIGERAVISSLSNVRYSLFKNSENEVKAIKLMTKHKIKNENEFELFEVNEESDGTQRIMDLIPAIMEISNDESVYVIDEIDRSLHPKLTYKLLELFFEQSKNIKSQLIATTHEDELMQLKLLRKDEIWFTKKNKFGESMIYSLEEFRPRKDKDIRSGYLNGRYEGIPKFDSFSNILRRKTNVE